MEASSPSSPSSQRSGYPFPGQDTLQRHQSASRYRPRRGSTASSIAAPSIGGSLDIPARRGSTPREASQNAISTLLQPPIVRTGLLPHTAVSAAQAGFRPPTARDIPPVALTNIPHVPPESFRGYLDRIGPLFDNFHRGKADPEQPTWQKKDLGLEKTDRFAEALQSRSSQANALPQGSPLVSSSTVTSPADTPGLSRRRSSATYRRNRNEPTPLSTIPSVYFDDNFHLENPRTFDVVSERAELLRPLRETGQTDVTAANGTTLPPRKALASNAILQEKLSWYMDTVEVHLINSISTASTGFFTALSSLKELQTEAEDSVAKIQSLREDLRRLDQEVAVSGLELAAQRRRAANLQKLGRATAQVQRVVEETMRADQLVEDGQFDHAADQMDEIGRLVCGHSEPRSADEHLIDLRPLKALQGLDTGLQELQARIGTGFAQKFATTLLNDVRKHLERVPPSDTLKRWSRQRGIRALYMETDDQMRQELAASLKGLQRVGHVAPATVAYREAVTKEMKSIIRKYLPSSNDDDADSMVSTSTRGGGKLTQQEKSSILARNLRALDGEDMERLLVSVYVAVGESLRRVSTQTKVLLDLTSSMQTSKVPDTQRLSDNMTDGATVLTPQISVQEEFSQTLDMSSLLGQAVDTAQNQIVRVLKVRNEQTVRLPKERFLRYFMLNRMFADECEAISGSGGQALKGLINAQISGFVQALGVAGTESTALLLDSDSWNAQDFSDHDDLLLQRVLSSMSADPPEWTKQPHVWEPLSLDSDTSLVSNGEPKSNGMSAESQPATAKASTTKPAYIDDTRYVLVRSGISLLPIIETFLSLTSSIPSMTPQISNSMLEILRTFNSRSCQLILGAGATRSAGLKNITTKHLALASQALSFVIAMVPYIRECVRRHLPASQTGVLAEFDKTKRLYQDHQSGIHDKLIEIMTARSQAHVKAMMTINFDEPAKSNTPSPYMETLTKETLTLHRVLSRHLSEVDVGMIMRHIFASYKEQWSKAFSETKAETEEGRRRLLRDAECLHVRLTKVEGFGMIGKEMMELVEKDGQSKPTDADPVDSK